MANYRENMYNYLKRKGYADKYDHAGIYCIKIDDSIVYIGKSHNMLKRVAQHYVIINTKPKEAKYNILAQAKRKGHKISFDVLYNAKGTNYYTIKNEIGKKEGEYIRLYKPILNMQIPKEENWKQYEVQDIDEQEILNAL